jgi:hypothetical protein
MNAQSYSYFMKIMIVVALLNLHAHSAYAALPRELKQLIAPAQEQCLNSLLEIQPVPFVGVAECIVTSGEVGLSDQQRRLVLDDRVRIDAPLVKKAINARCGDEIERGDMVFYECFQLLVDQEPDLMPYRKRISEEISGKLEGRLRNDFDEKTRDICFQKRFLAVSRSLTINWKSEISHTGLRNQIIEMMRSLYLSRRPQYLTDDEVRQFLNKQYKAMFQRFRTESQSLPAIRSRRDAEQRQQTFKEFVKNAALNDARMSRCPNKIASEALYKSELWIKYREPRIFTTSSTRPPSNRESADSVPEDLHESSVWSQLYSNVYNSGWRGQLKELYAAGHSRWVTQFAKELIEQALRTVNDDDFPDIMTRIERWRTTAYAKVEAVQSITGSHTE